MSNETAAEQESVNVEPGTVQETGNGNSDEIAKLRKEAAKWRTQLREAEAQIKELNPLVEQFKERQQAEMTEAEKLKIELEELKTARQAAETEAKRAQLMAYGVPESAVELVNVDALNWGDRDALKEQIAAFTAKPAPQAMTPGPAGNTPQQAINSIEDLRDMSPEDAAKQWASIKERFTPKSFRSRL